ncbi:hypothetical protein [Demequina globuliformis]|uniref:hypothetical protein n=1 Tax=Demequina globuliformis TaxID=676202 RepID=UPI00078220BF|nr:hypothetical protein [Demequina globuliformis]
MRSNDRYILVGGGTRGTQRWEQPADERSQDLPVERADTCRRSVRYKNKRSFQGFYPVFSTGQYVWHESLLELTSLMWLDRAGALRGVATQPFAVIGPHAFRHYIDFAFLQPDGVRAMVAVKPRRAIDADLRATFRTLNAVCRAIGWRFIVMSDMSRTEMYALQWQWVYREPWNALPTEAHARLFDAAQSPISLGEASTIACPSDPSRGLVGIYHELWRRSLVLVSPGTLRLGSLVVQRDGGGRAH